MNTREEMVLAASGRRNLLAASIGIPLAYIATYGVTLYPKRHADMRATWILKCADIEHDLGVLTDFDAVEAVERALAHKEKS